MTQNDAHLSQYNQKSCYVYLLVGKAITEPVLSALVKGTESGQQNLQVLFREILSWSDVGLELGKAEKELLPFPLLGQYRIGSI